MRILTYNVHKGFSAGNRRFELARMREAIRTSGADVVFLQEIQGEHRHHAERRADWINEAHFEYLADSVWSHHAYGRNAVYDHGHHGNAILCAWPLQHCDNINLTIQPLEQRGLLHAVIQPDGWQGPVHLLCTHLDLSGFTRGEQISRIAARIAAAVPADEPLILAGDFNDWRSQAHRRLIRELGLIEAHTAVNGRPARTFPSWCPMLRLDRVYLRGLQPTAAQRLIGGRWSGLSDHCALLVDIAAEPMPS